MAISRWKKLYLKLKDGEHSSDQRENRKKINKFNVHKIIYVHKQLKIKRKYLKTSAWKYNLLFEMKSHKQIAD